MRVMVHIEASIEDIKKRTNHKELNRLASKWNMDITNLNNMYSIKINIEHSRKEYLKLKT